MNACTRPLLRYFGGKWRLAPWIISHFPSHHVFTEVYGGGASVLLRKPRSGEEVYNDLDGELITLFRVLRSDRANDLINAVALTPFSRAEFDLAYEEDCDDPVEIARRLIVRSFFGFGGGLSIRRRPTRFRAVNFKAGNGPSGPWGEYPSALARIVERVQGVVIENRPAIDVLQAQDSPTTLHYVDPPYVVATRSPKRAGGAPQHGYRYDMDDGDQHELLDVLKALEGCVVLSGYPNEIYDRALSGWHRVEKLARDDAVSERVEVLWMNFNPAAAPPPGGMFEWGAVA